MEQDQNTALPETTGANRKRSKTETTTTHHKKKRSGNGSEKKSRAAEKGGEPRERKPHKSKTAKQQTAALNTSSSETTVFSGANSSSPTSSDPTLSSCSSPSPVSAETSATQRLPFRRSPPTRISLVESPSYLESKLATSKSAPLLRNRAGAPDPLLISSSQSELTSSRIGSEAFPSKPIVVYTRLSSEGRYVEAVPRRPPKLQLVSSTSESEQVRVRQLLEPEKACHSKSGDFAFPTVKRSSLSDGSQSTRTLETLTEDEVEEEEHEGIVVHDEDSYETATTTDDSSTEKSGGQTLSSSRQRICSPGSGKTLKLVKPPKTSTRTRGTSTGSAQMLLALAQSEVRKPVHMVYFFGKSRSGKSAVIQVLSTGSIGKVDLVKSEKVVRMKLSHNSNSEALHLEAVDTSRNYRAYLSQLQLKSASLIVFVYSVTDKESFTYTSRALEACFNMNIPIRCIVVANKLDCIPENPREVSSNEGIALAAAYKAFHVEVSCVTLHNIASLKTVILTTLQTPGSPKRGSSGGGVRSKPQSVFKSSSSSSILHTTPVSSSLSSSEVTSTDLVTRSNHIASAEDPTQHASSTTD